ncbi:MAG: ABC transporter permease subunit [Candidatus Endonucleobacter bathymodioli]|uniref:ABC transporter permease subunit n=1 Tax=Candidatus Endonucleibacter bathymodioli TaxID=539814 RepID=A0AA90SN55_9GAMM|nr:ABC transporter permease subunit [Candidatus Endonucleobacter bathymodioli]
MHMLLQDRVRALKSLWGRRLVIGVPYGWLLLFFLMPFATILKISFSLADVAIPPYTQVFTYVEEVILINLNLGNYFYLAEDPLYLTAYFTSIRLAFISTIICLLLGYPMAYAIAKAPKTHQALLLLLVLLPSCISFLIRVYAWMGILKNNGLLNNLLMWIGITNQPLQMLNTNIAVYIGIVYAYLPFMILPIFANLTKLDISLKEASEDLGAKPWRTFLSVTLPLSRSGIIAGSMLVFIPAVGEYVIPELLGGSNSLMIGKVLWQEFFNNRDWPLASALAMAMLLLLCIPITWFNYRQAKELKADIR